MIELLAPAGTPAKLRTALHFGADAVYVGLKRLSLRASAGNFGWDELDWALAYAHERGRRVYVAVNIQPFDADFADIEPTLRRLAAAGADGVIVADPGVVALARAVAPALPVHLSTQMSVTNAPAARFWAAQGVARICVARELSLAQLGALTAQAGLRLETFVHGAMCVAWSGRCFTSLYWAGRDPRRGACAQACRWPFREIEDRRRPGAGNPVEADERGTYFFDAKDLCALPVLDRLVATGIGALKIEGRTRSEHYVGAVVDVYRDALDRLAAGDLDGFHAREPRYLAELARPTNRGFSTHFLEGPPGADAYNPAGSMLARENDFVGTVVRAGPGFVEVELRNPLRPGARVELRDRGLACATAVAGEIRAPGGALLDLGRPPQTVRVPLAPDLTVSAGALVRFAPPLSAPAGA
ncbi:MAG TPA: peptidase U32 family protein [Polyangia bacterium]|jgi:putative protease